jgi:aminoglycoside 6'-N-acetyltransferase
MILYQNTEITVRELEKTDEELLVTWLSNPVLLEYYEGRDRPHDLNMVREHFYKSEEETRCIVEYAGIRIGYIQFYPLDKESRLSYDYGKHESIYGMDQFIGEIDYWNKGIGKILVTSMVEYLVNNRRVDKVVMDPQTWNERAIACYEKCGFKKVKLLKENEKHEGQLRDCWLIEYSTL